MLMNDLKCKYIYASTSITAHTEFKEDFTGGTIFACKVNVE